MKVSKKPRPPAVTHVEMQAERNYRVQRRAPRWVATGFSMFALAIMIFVIGGGEWLKACAPVCWGGVLMISVGSWTLLPSRRSHIINVAVTAIITAAIFIATPSAT